MSYGLDRSVDFALHGLMGVILNKPVYQLLGSKGPRETPVYSGMIYLDELNPGNESKSLDIILENCEWDYNYGYRMLKVKIGRSGRWYPHKDGLDKDIEVVKLIHGAYKGKNTQLLIDSNDMYSLEVLFTSCQSVSKTASNVYRHRSQTLRVDGRPAGIIFEISQVIK